MFVSSTYRIKLKGALLILWVTLKFLVFLHNGSLWLKTLSTQSLGYTTPIAALSWFQAMFVSITTESLS